MPTYAAPSPSCRQPQAITQSPFPLLLRVPATSPLAILTTASTRSETPSLFVVHVKLPSPCAVG
jgi:hypothetical protein